MMFVLLLFGGGLLSVFVNILRIPYAVILSLYLLLDLIFSFKISAKNSFKYFGYLVITFPILHLSYGIGFLLGLINFYIFKSSRIEDKNKELSR